MMSFMRLLFDSAWSGRIFRLRSREIKLPAVILFLLFAEGLVAQVPGESVIVERIVLDLRVTDSWGRPVTDLDPSELRVRLDGEPAEIESIEWISAGTQPAAEDRPGELTDRSVQRRLGRTIVLFFQTDFARQRVRGQMQIIPKIEEMIATITPADRVAVVQHDSGLRIRSDFTSDHQRLKAAVRKSLSLGDYSRPPAVPPPSLLDHLDIDAAHAAASPEKALLLLGSALAKFEGPKTIVMLGWGLGHFSRSGVRMDRLYLPARRVLEASRTSVFVLDISDADYHSLETGLITVAEETGGFYEKTHRFSEIAMNRLVRTIAGRHELVLLRPAGMKGGKVVDVDIQSTRRGRIVLAPSQLSIR